MTYKAIGFDWGGVISGKPGKFFNLGLTSILDISEESYREAYFHHNVAFNKGEITSKEQWTRVLNELDRSEKLTEVLAFVQERLKEDLNEEVVGLIDRLRKNGYKVGLLSNNTKEKGDELRASGFDKHFDAFDISADTGFVKPNPEAFVHLADVLGVAPDELIFIDDSEKSLSTSSEVGFSPILFETYEQLVQDLTELGIAT